MSADAAGAAKASFWFALFMTASVSMVIFNKLVMETFEYPNVLLIIQNSITIMLNVAGTHAGIFKMDPWQLDHFKVWALPTITFSIMLVTSLKALPLVAVATTVVFRNIGTVLVAIGDAAFFGKKFEPDHYKAIGVILFGSLVYSSYDINFHFTGYCWMTANTVIFACNMLYEKYAVVSVDQTAVGVSCYQNLISLPLLLVLAGSSGETAAMAAWFDLTMFMKGVIIITGFFGCLLSICYMSINKFASPTSITIASNLNKLVSAVLGGIVFKNAISIHTFVGLLICMAGGYLYSQVGKNSPPKEEETEVDQELAVLVPAADGASAAIDEEDDDKQN